MSMDTLPSSVSSLKVPRIHRTSSEFSHFKPPPTTSSSHHHLIQYSQNQLIISNSNSINNSISNSSNNKATSFPHHKNHLTTTIISTPFLYSNSALVDHQTSSSSLKQSPLLLHQKAASGYAAALIHVAQSNNSLQAVQRDVKRLLKLLRRNEQLRAFMSDPRVEEIEKGQVMKEITEKGRFHKHLVVLLNMLVHKTKVGILLSEVLAEFERIHHKLSGTQQGVNILVSISKNKKNKVVEENHNLFGIAKGFKLKA